MGSWENLNGIMGIKNIPTLWSTMCKASMQLEVFSNRQHTISDVLVQVDMHAF